MDSSTTLAPQSKYRWFFVALSIVGLLLALTNVLLIELGRAIAEMYSKSQHSSEAAPLVMWLDLPLRLLIPWQIGRRSKWALISLSLCLLIDFYVCGFFIAKKSAFFMGSALLKVGLDVLIFAYCIKQLPRSGQPQAGDDVRD